VRNKYTVYWMVGAFLAQCSFLYVRGELRGKCPLGDWGEILVFMAWSLTIFYLVIGSTYRVSLLGVFTAPLVTLMQVVAAVPGVLTDDPDRVTSIDPWNEMHAALSVLSYGALALSSIAAVMFLVLNSRIKAHDLTGGVFKNMPAVQSLITLVKRLVWVGFLILTVGILSSFKMDSLNFGPHFWKAICVWVLYAVYLGWVSIKGMKPGVLAKVCCGLFVVSLFVFGSYG